MQTLLFLLISFGISIAAIMLYLNQKNTRLKKLENGICPSCGAEPSSFFNEEKKITFKIEPIKKYTLKNNGCSGRDVKYNCTKCEHSEVYTL